MARATKETRAKANLCLALLVLCLSTRALIPAGWMPSFTSHGPALVPCSGFSTAEQSLRGAHSGGGEHAAHVGKGHDHPGKSKHDVAGQPCAFAAAALDLPSLASSAGHIELPAPSELFVKPPEVAIGRGLAAPPPPSTGPPITA